MEKLTPDWFGTLEADIIRRRDLIDSPDTDPEDKAFMRNTAVRSLDYSLDAGEITQEQRDKLMKLLGAIDPVLW